MRSPTWKNTRPNNLDFGRLMSGSVTGSRSTELSRLLNHSPGRAELERLLNRPLYPRYPAMGKSRIPTVTRNGLATPTRAKLDRVGPWGPSLVRHATFAARRAQTLLDALNALQFALNQFELERYRARTEEKQEIGSSPDEWYETWSFGGGGVSFRYDPENPTQAQYKGTFTTDPTADDEFTYLDRPAPTTDWANWPSSSPGPNAEIEIYATPVSMSPDGFITYYKGTTIVPWSPEGVSPRSVKPLLPGYDIKKKTRQRPNQGKSLYSVRSVRTATMFQGPPDTRDPTVTYAPRGRKPKHYKGQLDAPAYMMMSILLDTVSEAAEAWQILLEHAGIEPGRLDEVVNQLFVQGKWRDIDGAALARDLAVNILLDQVYGRVLGKAAESRKKLGLTHLQLP